jgi:serine/threonine protein kinase
MMYYRPGQTLLGKYRLENMLGQGAFAEVYLAAHLTLKVPRVLKVLRRDAPGIDSADYERTRARFKLEAQLGAALGHNQHVIRVYDFEEIDDTLVLVIDYATGGSLADRLLTLKQQDEIMSPMEAAKIAQEVATGLAALHQLDAVHRDIKPSNVLFDQQGRAQVADLGLAQLPAESSTESRMSKARLHPGTPQYMSPEQRESNDYLTPASDIYTLGAVMFEMLTGRVYRNMRAGTAPQDLRQDVPGWLNALVVRCLAQAAADRPWDGAEFLVTLNAGTGTTCAIPQHQSEAEPGVSPQTVPHTVTSWLASSAEEIGLREETSSDQSSRVRDDTPVGPSRRSVFRLWGIAGIVVLALLSFLMGRGIGVPATSLPTESAVVPTPIPPTEEPTLVMQNRELPTALSPKRTPTATPTTLPSPSASPILTQSVPLAVETRATATPQATSKPASIAPQLTQPAMGSQSKNPVNFSWQGNLGTGQSYLLQAWHVETAHMVEATTQNASHQADVPAEKIGMWRWHVYVVQGGNIMAKSPDWEFWFNPVPGATADESPQPDDPAPVEPPPLYPYP